MDRDKRANAFACVIHPLRPKEDVARQYPLLARVLPVGLIHFLSRFWPPLYLSRIRGVRSEATGKEVEGVLLACPFTARRMLTLAPRTVYAKLVQTGRLAERLGVRLLGLLAFTSSVGDGGVTVSQRLDIPVTTGRSLTVATVLEAIEVVAQARGLSMDETTIAVLGATGSIGRACALCLAPAVGRVVLIGLREDRLAEVANEVGDAGAGDVCISTCVDAVRDADLIISATNAIGPLIRPAHLKQGAVIYDVAIPSDVSPQVTRERKDVVVIAGGVMDVPGDVDFGFDFGLPPGKAYACMAETMVLALEERYESYSLGKQIQVEKVHEIAQLARQHGFRLTELSAISSLCKEELCPKVD
jgi:fatty aldehyde-generating acyl-ACP reductase